MYKIKEMISNMATRLHDNTPSNTQTPKYVNTELKTKQTERTGQQEMSLSNMVCYGLVC